MKHTYGFNTTEDIVLITENIFSINGYSFGDRLLEDVMFEVTVVENKIVNIEVEKSAEGYLESLNKKLWLKRAKDFAEEIIKYGDEVELPKRLQKKYNVKYAFYGTND